MRLGCVCLFWCYLWRDRQAVCQTHAWCMSMSCICRCVLVQSQVQQQAGHAFEIAVCNARGQPCNCMQGVHVFAQMLLQPAAFKPLLPAVVCRCLVLVTHKRQ
jgi:hypothetical protein